MDAREVEVDGFEEHGHVEVVGDVSNFPEVVVELVGVDVGRVLAGAGAGGGHGGAGDAFAFEASEVLLGVSDGHVVDEFHDPELEVEIGEVGAAVGG